MTPSTAAGISRSTFSNSRSSRDWRSSASEKPRTVPVRSQWLSSLEMSRPNGWRTAPYWSLTATTFTPASHRRRAAPRPTFPNLCTAAEDRSRERPRCASAVKATWTAPRDVAAGRPPRASELPRLASHGSKRGIAAVDRVRVHHPGHHLLVGADIRRRYVIEEAEDRHQLAGVAPGDPFDLAGRVAAWIEANSTLGAAIRNVHESALPGHPHGERPHFVEGDIGRVSEPTLGRPARHVVLHTVPRQNLDAAIVTVKRDRDGDRAEASPTCSPSPV